MSEVTADLTPEECIPDTPDVGSELTKVQSQFGKRPSVDFFPPDFNVDVSKFFNFNMFGKILGKSAGGLGFDTCAVCIDGDIDGALSGGPVYPEGLGGVLEGIDSDISGLQDQVDEIGDSAP